MHYTISASELYNGLANTLHFAGNERAYPELNALLITTSGNQVLFTAASRESAAQAIATPLLADDDQLAETRALVPVAEAKKLASFLKPVLKEDLPLTIALDGLSMTVQNPADLAQIRLELADDTQYPDIDQLWPTEPVGAEVLNGVRLLDPSLFRKLSKVRAYTLRPWSGSAAMSMGLGNGAGDAILVTYRDWFRALLRPLNPGTAAGVLEGVNPNFVGGRLQA